MNMTQELERLARLHDDGKLSDEEFAKAKSQVLSAPALAGVPFRSIRRQSSHTVFGLPLWAIAIGPDLERGEMRGHARAIFALGDIATGWFAFGGLARGIFAFGGLAIGLVAVGGLSVGLLVALGGGAVGGIAMGGGAVGAVAIGGGACGYYALAGAAVGVHTVSGLHQDPEALSFFHHYLSWLRTLLHR